MFLLCGLILLTGFWFSACQSSQNQKTTLTLSTWGSAQELQVLKALIREYEITHPDIQVEILHIPENYYQKLHLLIAANQAPDVIFTNSISFPTYAAHNVFLDLHPRLIQSQTLSVEDFYPASLKAFTWQDGRTPPILGALPRDVSNLVIYYNQDLFQQAGLSPPTADWDWNSFLKTAQALTKDTNGDGGLDQFGISFYAKPPLFWMPFVWSAGETLFSHNFEDIQLSEANALQALQFYGDLRNKYHVAPRQVESGSATMSQMFLQGKLAMMVSGRWSVPVLREQATFHWDVVPFPKGPVGESRVGIDASGYAIAAKTEHPDESFELVEFLLSQKALTAFTESGLIIPARPDVANSPVFLAPGQTPQNSQAFLEVIPTGVPTHTPPRWNEIAEELTLALQAVWDGKQTAEEAVMAISPKLERMLRTRPQ